MPSRILYNLAMIVTVPMKYTIKKKKKNTYVFFGGGREGAGVSKMIVMLDTKSKRLRLTNCISYKTVQRR